MRKIYAIAFLMGLFFPCQAQYYEGWNHTTYSAAYNSNKEFTTSISDNLYNLKGKVKAVYLPSSETTAKGEHSGTLYLFDKNRPHNGDYLNITCQNDSCFTFIDTLNKFINFRISKLNELNHIDRGASTRLVYYSSKSALDSAGFLENGKLHSALCYNYLKNDAVITVKEHNCSAGKVKNIYKVDKRTNRIIEINTFDDEGGHKGDFKKTLTYDAAGRIIEEYSLYMKALTKTIKKMEYDLEGNIVMITTIVTKQNY